MVALHVRREARLMRVRDVSLVLELAWVVNHTLLTLIERGDGLLVREAWLLQVGRLVHHGIELVQHHHLIGLRMEGRCHLSEAGRNLIVLLLMEVVVHLDWLIKLRARRNVELGELVLRVHKLGVRFSSLKDLVVILADVDRRRFTHFLVHLRYL